MSKRNVQRSRYEAFHVQAPAPIRTPDDAAAMLSDVRETVNRMQNAIRRGVCRPDEHAHLYTAPIDTVIASLEEIRAWLVGPRR